MSKIERLTDEARERLTAALKAAERKAESWERGHDYAWAEKAKAEARAEALQARTAELEAENVRLKGTPDLDFPDAPPQETDRQAAVRWYRRANAAESELAQMRGRVERALTVYSYFEREDLPAEVALRRIAEVLRGR